MKTKVSQCEFIVNIRYAKACDYVYAYNIYNGEKNKIETIFTNIFKHIKNDTRNYISIYSKLDYLPNLLNNIKNINKKFILVTGCSDAPIKKNMLPFIPNNIVKWYAENVEVQNSLVVSLPMGSISGTWIGNNIIDCEWNTHPKCKLINTTNDEPEIKNLVFMCFSIETNASHRREVYDYFKNKSWTTNLCKENTGKYLEDELFMKNIYNHYFTISPFGNGIDCGRTWSILQMGGIPIIPYHYAFEKWAENLPILLYHNLNEITEEYLNIKLKEFSSKKYNYDYLKTSYWKSIFEQNKLN